MTHAGGHTSEALALVSALDFSRYTPRLYIISEGDSLSAEKAVALEARKTSSNKVCLCTFGIYTNSSLI
jgi:beta-1,4-N-acetylglucosaminyltransferase